MKRQIKHSNENVIQVFCYSCLLCCRGGSKNLRMKRAVAFSCRTKRKGSMEFQKVGDGVVRIQSRVTGKGTNKERAGCLLGLVKT